MDANVQVALVSVLATTITTSGVIIVAIINGTKERERFKKAGIGYKEEGIEEVLDRLLMLIEKNEHDEAAIRTLTLRIRILTKENNSLRAKLNALTEYHSDKKE
jgi:hypothetical protein